MLKKLGLPGTTKQLFRKGGQVLVKDKAQTCPVCSGNGFFGQIGVYEVHPIGDGERKLIAQNDITGLRAAFRQKKELSIQQAGIMHVVNGETSIEEVVRITGGGAGGGGGAAKPAAQTKPTDAKPAADAKASS